MYSERAFISKQIVHRTYHIPRIPDFSSCTLKCTENTNINH